MKEITFGRTSDILNKGWKQVCYTFHAKKKIIRKTKIDNNASKRSSIMENLIDIIEFASNYKLSRLIVIYHCINFTDLVKLSLSQFIINPK